MPIHEYRCADCGHVSELLVGIGRNSDQLVCASCGSAQIEALMSAASISVKAGPPGPIPGSTCCGSNPSAKGCVPGSCCGMAE